MPRLRSLSRPFVRPTSLVPPLRRARWGALAALLTGLGSAAAAAAPAPTPGREDHHLQWPMGACVEDRFVAGYAYHPYLDYDQISTVVSDRCTPTAQGGYGLSCPHAGLDMRHYGLQTLNHKVFAMADGEVVDLLDWGSQGTGVLVEHDNGTFVLYGHLRKDDADVVYVRRGQRVRAGQPIGHIMDYPSGGPDNDHLHMEIRDQLLLQDVCVSGDCSGVNASAPARYADECLGVGYAVGETTADVHGNRDPKGAYFENRPANPMTIAAITRSGQDLEYFDAAGASAGRLSSATLYASTGEPEADANGHYWYDVVVGDVTYTAQGYHDAGSASDTAIGEVPQIARDWMPPDTEPFIDLRFGDAAGNRNLDNWGTGADATVAAGALTTTSPYAFEPNMTPLCDRVADLDGATRLDVAVDKTTSFVGGVAIELSLRLDAFEDGGTIAASGSDDDLTWRLHVRKEGEVRQLVFEVTSDSSTAASVMDLPEPRCMQAVTTSRCAGEGVPEAEVPTAACPGTAVACDPDADADADALADMPAHCFEDFGYRQWRQVAARYDSSTGEVRLYWDGMLVQDVVRLAAGSPLDDAGDRTVRIGDGLALAVDDVRIWAMGEVIPGKEDAVFDFDDPRGTADQGCSCTSEPGTGSTGALPLLLGIWLLRRRRSAA